MIQKELQDYWKAENALRVKIYEYLDAQDKKIDIWLTKDNEEEVHFVAIKNKMLTDDSGYECDYKGLNIGELLDVHEQIEQC